MRHVSLSRRRAFWVCAALLALLLATSGAAPSGASPSSLIVIPGNWQQTYPFSARFVDMAGLPDGTHLIDLAAARFVTDDLVKRSGEGSRQFLPAPSETFPPRLVGNPFEQADQDYFLVQAQDAMAQLRVRRWLEQRGLTIIGYVLELAYLVRLDAASLEEAKHLPDVFWIGYFYPAFRISPRLDYIAQVDPLHELHMTVQLDEVAYQNAQAVSTAVSAASLKARTATKVADGWLLRVHGAAQDARSLALLPGCLWVERWVEPRLANNIARSSANKATGRGSVDGPIMDVEDVWEKGIHGEGQIAAIADTGLSTGKLSDPDFHHDFGQQGHSDNPMRVIKAYALGPGRSGDWSDDQGITNSEGEHPGGHGTHTAGSLMGNGKMSGSDPHNNIYPEISYAGIAPRAQLVFQSVMGSDGKFGGLPPDLNTLFQLPYNDGARVHSNSWGSPVGGSYTTYSKNVDRYVWVHQDMVITFSAGNDGVDGWHSIDGSCLDTGWPEDGVIDPISVEAPGTAKNCITVGASENYRPGFQYEYPKGSCNIMTWSGFDLSSCAFQHEPLSSDLMANDAHGMAPFSSRGPTLDDRIKPDLVAPGTAIISTRTNKNQAYQQWGTCAIPEDLKPYYITMGGTSMANPLTAGAAVLVRQYYVDGWHPNGSTITHDSAPVAGDGFSPSAALVKATLINGAWDMTPGQYGTGPAQEIPPSWESSHTLPNDVEGFGRVDLEHSLFPGHGWGDDPNRRMAVYDVSPGLQTGQWDAYTFNVAFSANPLIVTLVWTDPDALADSFPKLVNNLDLVVTSPGGVRYYPNGVNLTSGSPDTRNNVEQVKVTSPETGVWSISVEGTAVPGNGLPDSTTQPYALVISGVSQTELEASLTANPASGQATLTSYLVASAAGTASGTINYSFWWDCDDPGTSVSDVSAVCGALPTPSGGSCAENANGYKCDGLAGTITSVATPNHTYSSPGVYTGKVIIERGTAPPAEARAAINALGTTPGVPTPLSPGASTGPGPEIDTLTPTLQWQGVPGADWYGVYVSVSPYGPDNLVYDNESVPGNATSLQLPPGTLSAGKQYRWNMRARNASGFSDFSGRLYFTTGTCLADAPANVQAIPQGADSIQVSWDPSSGAVGYKVYRGTYQIADLASGVTIFTDTGLSSGTEYCYTVAALDNCGGQTSSAEMCARTMGYSQGCASLAGKSTMGYKNRYANDIVVRGTFAFTADFHGLGVWDVSDSAHPMHVAQLDTPETGEGVALGPGNLVILADGTAGLFLVDMTDPTRPHLVGSYDTPGSAHGIAVSGSLAYVADSNAGLQLIDIIDPANPLLLGSYKTPDNAYSVAVSSSIAYIAENDSGIQIVDVSDPSAPALLGTYSTPWCTEPCGWGAVDLSVSGGLLYVAGREGGLGVIDASNPTTPILIGSYSTPGYAFGVVVSDSVAYVAEADGLDLVDVSNPTAPTLLGSSSLPGGARQVAVLGTFAYVAGSEVLQVINVADPVAPALLGGFKMGGYAQGVTVSGTAAYVADNTEGLQIIDVSASANPVLLGSYGTPGWSKDVAVSGGIAYVADDTSLQMIDVSNPAAPLLLGSYHTPGDAVAVAVSGNVAYVANKAGFQIIDVSNPAAPTLLGSYDTPGTGVGVAVSGNVAYVVGGKALQVVDVSNPAAPSLLASYDTPGFTEGIAVSGSIAYVVDGYSLQVIDVSNPAAPALLGIYSTPNFAQAVAVSGNIVYVADGNSLQMIDVSNPSAPVLLGSYETPAYTDYVAVSGGIAYLTDGLDMLLISLNCKSPEVSFSWEVWANAVDFTDQSLYGPTSWSWDFGDGTSSTQQNPSHTYAAAGTYTVTLTVSNSYGSSQVSHPVTVTSPSSSLGLPIFAACDYNGDNKADIGVYRNSNGYWYIRNVASVRWGVQAGDVPVPGDYDGNGTADLAVYRPSTGYWYIKGGSYIRWGVQPGDVPVPGDYNGDGKTDIAVYRPSNGTWYIKGGPYVTWGVQPGDVPVPGDYNGDGKTDIAIFRPSEGTWYIKYPAGYAAVRWGVQPGDIPVPGDYDGDGKTDIAVYRHSNGYWYIKGGPYVRWGIQSGDIPVQADYTGNGKCDIAVYRPSTGYWYIKDGPSVRWGIQPGDMPVARGEK